MKLSDVVVDRSDLLLNVCASTGLVAMDKIQVQTPKGRCEKLQSVDPARRGRSNVSLIYLLQRPRVSPNSVLGALVKLSTKKNRFPHTFSKARALECNYSVHHVAVSSLLWGYPFSEHADSAQPSIPTLDTRPSFVKESREGLGPRLGED